MSILTDYTPPAKAAPYADVIDALIEAGDGAAYELISKTKNGEGERGQTITGERAKFQAAARAADRSAKIVERDEREDGTTRVVFILTAKRTRSTVEPTEDTPTSPAPPARGRKA